MDTNLNARVTAKDFFLWAGAMVALYWSIVSFLVLIFEYVDRLFPDPVVTPFLDPYSGGIRFAMASLIVLGPLAAILLRLIRRDIMEVPAKAEIWVRRWALMLTLFVAGVTVAVDLIVLINTFLGGELTTRFALKVLAVLVVAGAGFLHFWADLKGYYRANPSRGTSVGVAFGVLMLLTVGAGFFIIGSPSNIRDLRIDQEKRQDLMSLQWSVVNYWQQKQKLPVTINDLSDGISGYVVTHNAQTGEPYRYEATSDLSFKLCATFRRESPTTDAYSDGYSMAKPIGGGGVVEENWKHGVGDTCFERTIDPERYPPYPGTVR